MNCLKNNIIVIEKQKRKSGGTRTIYKCKCNGINCNNQVKIRSTEVTSHSGLCLSCSHKKKPFESIYKRLMNDWRKLNNNLTYKEFLEFTSITNCYYCDELIKWNEYSHINGKFISTSYFLDRKNNNLGYIKDNCVVCCTICNKFKGSMNHDDFINLCNRIALKRSKSNS